MTARKDPSSGGFTLVELMMVVVIIGVLSAIAMPLYSRSRYRAYALEATEVLGRITAAQEGYRATFNTYADTSTDFALTGTANGTSGLVESNWWPALSTRDADGLVDFYTSLPPSWNQLGVRPRQRVRYSYQTVAGLPGVSPSVGGTDPTLGYASLPTVQRGSWFVAVASGDLDRDNVYSRFLVSSLTPGVQITDETE